MKVSQEEIELCFGDIIFLKNETVGRESGGSYLLAKG